MKADRIAFIGRTLMVVLFLGPQSKAVDIIRASGDSVLCTTDPMSDVVVGFDFIVSYNYKHIIKNRSLLAAYDGRAINLHISYLPWNRGYHPNVWSFIENTPKGVTIHYMDAGIDTGDIIVQRHVSFDRGDTLATSHAKLQAEMCDLFAERWPKIRIGECDRRKQGTLGTFHLAKDLKNVETLLTNGWDTLAFGLGHDLRTP